ncbi:MAG: SLATT domain-containing protein [Nitrosomonas sp.]|nr:SLATT domain-containing protein [Nitrosomonas sp.]
MSKIPQSLPTWLQRLRPEDPRRIKVFRAKLEDLTWDKQNALRSLSTLFAAVDDLAEAEVYYYYRRRGTRAWISGVTRTGAWLLGTVGLLLPLLAGTNAPIFKDWGQYGYAFLAAAASCLAANALFGGTEGHIRFVSTQLELERLITTSRVAWCKYLAGQHETDDDLAEGFTIILGYASALYTATITETGRWGETLLVELAKFQKSIEAKGSTSGKEK